MLYIWSDIYRNLKTFPRVINVASNLSFTWVQSLGAELNFTAPCCERSHHDVIDVATLDVAHVTAALPGCGRARVVVPAARQLCDVAVAAAGAAPVEPQRVTGHPVEPDPWRTAGTWEGRGRRGDSCAENVQPKRQMMLNGIYWHKIKVICPLLLYGTSIFLPFFFFLPCS